jgi:hypothetical protein
MAATAFVALGLDRLAGTPELASSQLIEIAKRSQTVRRQERAVAEASGPPLISGHAIADGVFLKDFEASGEGPFTWIDSGGVSRAVTLNPRNGGSLVGLGDLRTGGGCYQLGSDSTTIAFVLLNDALVLSSTRN